MRRLAALCTTVIGPIGSISPNARRYLVATFMIWVNFYAPQFLLTLYLRELGLADEDIGLVAGARMLGSAAAILPAAFLARRYSLKHLLIFGAAFFGFFSLCLLGSSNRNILVLLSALSGAAHGVVMICAAPFVARNSTKAERATLFSISFAITTSAGVVSAAGCGTVATVLGEVLGSDMRGLQWALAVAAAASLAAVVPLLGVRESQVDNDDATDGAPGTAQEMSPRQARWRVCARLAVLNLAIGAGAGLVIPFTSLYLQDRFDMSSQAIGFAFVGAQLMMAISSLGAPALMNRFGMVRGAILVQVLSIPFLIVLAETELLALALVAFVLRSGLVNVAVPMVSNLSMELVRREDQPLANAVSRIAWNVAWACFSALAGIILSRFDYSVLFNLAAAGFLLAAALLYFLFRHAEERQPNGLGWRIVGALD